LPGYLDIENSDRLSRIVETGVFVLYLQISFEGVMSPKHGIASVLASYRARAEIHSLVAVSDFGLLSVKKLSIPPIIGARVEESYAPIEIKKLLEPLQILRIACGTGH
jgi:hypothetical protein